MSETNMLENFMTVRPDEEDYSHSYSYDILRKCRLTEE